MVQTDIEDLAESILAVGLLQEPRARPVATGYQLAFGHSASRPSDCSTAGGLGADGHTEGRRALRPGDGLHSFDREPGEEGPDAGEEITAWARVLREIPGVTIQGLADKVGVDRTTMSKNLAILDLPGSVLALWTTGA